MSQNGPPQDISERRENARVTLSRGRDKMAMARTPRGVFRRGGARGKGPAAGAGRSSILLTAHCGKAQPQEGSGQSAPWRSCEK